jgi:hypothetical protein
MSISDARRKSRSAPVVSESAPTRLTGSRLIIARTVWLALVVLGLGLFVAGLPVFYTQLQRACVSPATCSIEGALTTKALHALPAFGFSASGYAALLTIFYVIYASIWGGIGFLIFWRRSDDRFALLTAFFLVIFIPTYPGTPAYALTFAYPVLTIPTMLINFLGQVSFILFFLLFPNGRLVPRWMGLVLLLVSIQIAASVFPPASPFSENNWPAWFDTFVNLAGYCAVIFSQIYRYRRVSTPIQRQQTKWVVFSMSIVLIGFIAFTLIFIPVFSQPNTLSSLLPTLAYPLLFLLLPFSIGIAILRHRLYDIDALINRTLVYATLTGVLALVYFGSVILLQALVRQLSGQTGQLPVVTVVSTLLIAALFQPLRYRIRGIIDLRFYRRKYDAAKTVAAFSATLRNEVELSQLREHLLTVVQETMQPAHVSLWLRPPEQDGTQRVPWRATSPGPSEGR